eukprot:88511-Pleurochrysis_carterae.AAC.4
MAFRTNRPAIQVIGIWMPLPLRGRGRDVQRFAKTTLGLRRVPQLGDKKERLLECRNAANVSESDTLKAGHPRACSCAVCRRCRQSSRSFASPRVNDAVWKRVHMPGAPTVYDKAYLAGAFRQVGVLLSPGVTFSVRGEQRLRLQFER